MVYKPICFTVFFKFNYFKIVLVVWLSQVFLLRSFIVVAAEVSTVDLTWCKKGVTACLFVSFSVTPQHYQPPGFKEADGDTMEFEREPVKLTMGEVVTPFHTLKLDMATERQRLEQVMGMKHETDRKVTLKVFTCIVGINFVSFKLS